MTIFNALFATIVWFPLIAISGAYVVGTVRAGSKSDKKLMRRHIFFSMGIVLLALSVAWPFETLAREHFFIHQIGFLIARILAPMLVALAHPAAFLIRGLPRPVRSRVLKPAMSARTTRRAWCMLRTPALATAIYIGIFCFWEVPVIQDRAITNPIVGAVMHISLFGCGIVFWSRVFDRRPQPHGMSHPSRLMMLWLAILTQILAGATITLKAIPWYPAYDLASRTGIPQRLTDEMIGGFFVWIPSSLATLAGLILVIDMWGRHETRMDIRRTAWSPSNSAILLYPETASALRASTKQKNRKLALTMLTFALFIMSMAFGTAIVSQMLSNVG